MNKLLPNIRFQVLVFSFLLSVVIYFFYAMTTSQQGDLISSLIRAYALTATFYLYIALMASPLTAIFPTFPNKGQYIKARRAIGVSAFYFGLLHFLLAVNFEIGGIEQVPYLTGDLLIAVICGLVVLVILFLLAITSIDKVIGWMTFPYWKLLQRFVYAAVFLITVHALLIGSNFQNLNILSGFYIILLLSLVGVETYRFSNFLTRSRS